MVKSTIAGELTRVRSYYGVVFARKGGRLPGGRKCVVSSRFISRERAGSWLEAMMDQPDAKGGLVCPSLQAPEIHE